MMLELTPVYKMAHDIEISHMIRDVFEDFELDLSADVLDGLEEIDLDFDF